MDYKVTYSSNTKPGTAKIKVKGIGNYTGTASGTFKIRKAEKNIYILCYGADRGAAYDVSLVSTWLKKNKLSGYKLKRENTKAVCYNSMDDVKFNQTVEKVFANTTDDDISFIYICAHGKGISAAYQTSDKGVKVNKVTFTGFSTGVDARESYLWLDYLNFLGSHIKGRIVLMTETCGSGGLVDAAPQCNAADRITVFSASSSFLSSNNWYDFTGIEVVDTLVALYVKKVMREDGDLGLFTTALAIGLGYQNGGSPAAASYGDGKVRVNQLYSYIRSNNRVYASGQQPQLYAPDQNMVIFEK